VKTLLAGPSPTSPMKAEITISPISNIIWLHAVVSCKSRLVVKHPKNSNKINGIFSDSSIPHEKLMRLSKLQSFR